MERFKIADKRIFIVCLLFFATGIITCMIPVRGFVPHNMSAFSYCSLVIIWGLSIRRRILDIKVRHRIITSCVFMILLFILRMCKFSFFPDLVEIEEMVWYAYYIPMTAIPLFMFFAALRVEPVKNARRINVAENVLICIEAVICIVVLTNGAHGMVFDIQVHPDKEYSRNWFYYIILAWMVGFGLATFVMIFRKCSLSLARKRWYIPAIFIAAGMVMLFWYLINGGSPKLHGYKLFQMQEAYCIPYLTAIEGIIQTGLLAANAGYETLFDYSGINACIYDKVGSPVLSSRNWKEGGSDEDHRICSEDVSGGSISWAEDIGTIRRLNTELEEVTEALENENELIRQENEVRAERVSYETRNRLYNRIATAVRVQALKVNELLSKEAEDPEEKKKDLMHAAILSAYIKRMGNIMLLTDKNSSVDTEEIYLAFRESLDYLSLKGCVCDIVKSGNRLVASSLILLSYELFEAAIEDVWSRLNSCVVSLDCEDGYELNIALDAMADSITSVWKDRQIKEAGGRLTVWYEDDTHYIKLEGIS
ncbi:MAG: hypothetical protein J6X66_14045 [Lachnospiraceae bacterium]|nr:hypothetical protein [Lachnospiraceae bacterium]